MGYHKNQIDKGVYQEFSKIEEEFLECKDAHEQGVSLMLLQELSDLYGAIDGFLRKHHPSIGMEDLKKMHQRTASAFDDGTRK